MSKNIDVKIFGLSEILALLHPSVETQYKFVPGNLPPHEFVAFFAPQSCNGATAKTEIRDLEDQQKKDKALLLPTEKAIRARVGHN